MKKCSRCKKEKDYSEFNKKNNGLSTYCKNCNKEYLKNHYENNKSYYKEKAEYWKQEKQKFLNSLKESSPCVDCGKYYQACQLDYHHLEPSLKLFNISTARHAVSIEKLLEEIKKCELLCSNCHRLREFITEKIDLNKPSLKN